MEDLVRFVVNYEVGIYLVLGIVLVISIQRLVRSWLLLRKANFGMEKEVAQKGIRSSLTFIVLVMLFGISNFILVSIASVRFPGIAPVATPTVNPVAANEDSPNNEPAEENVDVPLTQTQTASALRGCAPGVLEWITPGDGEEVSGSVELAGTVNLPNLGFYKYEYRAIGDDIWIPISAGNKPIIEEPLGGTWNTEELIPGDYILRLVVSDNANNLLEPCEIEVKVIN